MMINGNTHVLLHSITNEREDVKMEFYEAVNTRRTVRDFTDAPVEMDVVRRILKAGMKAPTNDHMRDWEFVVLTDKQRIAEILSPIPKTYPKEKFQSWTFVDDCQQDMYHDGVPKQYQMLSQSNCLVLPFYKQHTPLLAPENLSALNSFASIWCVIENILLATTAEGLGAAIRIPFDSELEHILDVLGHPAEYIMPCFIALGHPSPTAANIRQKDFNADEKIHVNQWVE